MVNIHTVRRRIGTVSRIGSKAKKGRCTHTIVALQICTSSLSSFNGGCNDSTSDDHRKLWVLLGVHLVRCPRPPPMILDRCLLEQVDKTSTMDAMAYVIG